MSDLEFAPEQVEGPVPESPGAAPPPDPAEQRPQADPMRQGMLAGLLGIVIGTGFDVAAGRARANGDPDWQQIRLQDDEREHLQPIAAWIDLKWGPAIERLLVDPTTVAMLMACAALGRPRLAHLRYLRGRPADAEPGPEEGGEAA